MTLWLTTDTERSLVYTSLHHSFALLISTGERWVQAGTTRLLYNRLLLAYLSVCELHSQVDFFMTLGPVHERSERHCYVYIYKYRETVELFCLIKYLTELTMNQPPFLHASSPAATMEYPEFSASERAHAVVSVSTCSCKRQSRWKWSHPDWLAENIYGSGVRERNTVARAKNLHLSVCVFGWQPYLRVV